MILSVRMRILMLVCGLFVTYGCTTDVPKIYRQGALIDQILVFRHGHVGPTTGNCEAFGPDGKCANFVIKTYSLADQNTRDLLRLAHFLCLIGDKRYLVSPDRAGIFHRTYTYRRFLGAVVAKHPVDEFIPETDSEKLATLGTTCFSEDRFDAEEM